MRRLLKWLFRLGLVLVLLAGILLLPVGYVELSCIRKPVEANYAALLPVEHHRAESRTLLTYPEWHIVHAYDDYAWVISDGDPHQFGFLRAITGFWSSLCELSYASAEHGGFPDETKQMVYTIGVSFTAEMLAKAAYEETIGRLATLMRGKERAPLDDLSARQAMAYAKFLQQVPWYQWDFSMDAQELLDNNTGSFRDTERLLALQLEYGVKSIYAGVIEQAVVSVGADELRLRMVVHDATAEILAGYEGVTVIGPNNEGVEIETPRYRELTDLLNRMAQDGVNFTEIAGNDDILLTATAPGGRVNSALYSFPRQGYDDFRHLILLKVTDLAQRLREMQTGPLTLEHIHDY
ncbi:hypothetical protein [uncultured Roseovarius sp.]|uniref:hypothetical protein n=1 Tax=uncultured Roseovarius sp. TaxID=293344 RepID=UPI00261B7166|nr:hypothetical protein [uncultured Roseovarius sp.]